MYIISYLQEKLNYLRPNCTWGISGTNLSMAEDWLNDYDRIIDWTGTEVIPTKSELEAVTQQELDDFLLDKNATKEVVDAIPDYFKALVIWIAQKTNTPVAQVRDELKTIWKSLQS